MIDDSGKNTILLKNPNGLGGSYEFGDSLSLKAEQFIDLLPEAVTSSPIAQALANVADGYEADLSYGLEFNAGMIFGYDAGAQKLAASSILTHVQHVRLENIGRRRFRSTLELQHHRRRLHGKYGRDTAPIWSWCGSSAKARSLPYKQRKCAI